MRSEPKVITGQRHFERSESEQTGYHLGLASKSQ